MNSEREKISYFCNCQRRNYEVRFLARGEGLK